MKLVSKTSKWIESEIKRLAPHTAAKVRTPNDVAAYCRGKRAGLVSVLRMMKGQI